MTIDDIYRDIAKQRPPVIFVTGKTSTGKSTFARKLHDELGYQVIGLEAILVEIIKKHRFDEQSTFYKVLYDANDCEEKTLFLNTIDRLISVALTQDHPVVIEGAIKNVGTLKYILRSTKGLFFLYFHPINTDVYMQNLTKRFVESGEKYYSGLPLSFWKLIDKEEFRNFCITRKLTESLTDSIAKYAQISQKESLDRLNEFRENFKEIKVVVI